MLSNRGSWRVFEAALRGHIAAHQDASFRGAGHTPQTNLDDFGVDSSSLRYLRKFRLDRIKIDRSLVGTLGESDESAAIVRTIASLGAVLGVETTAEGVETAEQLEFVHQSGCAAVRGYYFGHPRPATDVASVIERLNDIRRVA